MTRIVLIDPKNELVLHSISIETKGDAKRLEDYWHQEEQTRGYEVDRIIVSMGTSRIMDRNDPVPVPVYAAGQLCKTTRSGS